MSLRRLARTSVFRITLLYVVLFSVSAAILLLFVGLVSFGVLDRQIRSTVAADVRGLTALYERRGLAGLQRGVARRAARDRFNLYLLMTPGGRVLAGNLSAWPDAASETVRSREDGWIEFLYEREGPDDRVRDRLAYAMVVTLPPGIRMLVGRDVDDRRVIQRQLTRTVLISIVLVIVLGLAGGIFLARRSARQIEAINEALDDIMAGDLTRRIDVGRGKDELTRLAVSLNAMLDRIEALLRSLREVSENIAHDLRSPLNRMRSDLDLSLMRGRDPQEDQAVLERTVEEVSGLVGTFEALLAIARAEAGGDGLEKSGVSLRTVVEDALDLYGVVLEDKSISLDRAIADDGIVRGHRGSLMQAVSNLLDNAVKFAPEGSTLTVALDSAEGQVVLSITDEGPGIPVEARERVFDRFVRLDAARRTPGSGLGLSLVRAVAGMHGARLSLESGPEGRGLKVTLAFPGID
ncbi:MAG: ATP-binding protein [Alphaproteobacteria bacterium]|nr:ATP-binding protein [Alphaproteobacteria bacterium]